MTKILTVIERAYHGTIEEEDDTILWLTHMFKMAGADTDVLLRGNAVNYAVKAQDAGGVTIGGNTLSPPTLAQDVAHIMARGVAVYAVSKDLTARGIAETDLVEGVQVIRQRDVAKLWDSHDAIWHW